MSAIVGLYHFKEEASISEHGESMMDNLRRFPCNRSDEWQNDKVFLGCHSQWITPESINEILPFYDDISKTAITADAIIDNRDELFNRLGIKKSKRKDITDSQLILSAYLKWEEEAPKYLVGDFAFMIWDERKQKFFGARDFSGGRTLYYYIDHKRFTFCSLLQPFFTQPYISKEINEMWVAEYLAITGMIDVADSSITPFEKILQVPPAHSITVSKGVARLNRYCTLTSREKLHLKSNEEYIEAFKDVFQEAVISRLRTFHNVGAQLSGGLDSGSIVGFASQPLRQQNKILHTFSYVPQKDFNDFTPKHLLTNETPLIKQTVNYVGNIEAHYLDFDGRDSYTEIDDFLEVLETPYKFFENSFWLKGMYEKANEMNIGVLLNGGRGNLSISWGTALNYYALLLKKMKWNKLFQELNHYSQNIGGPRLRLLPLVGRIAFPVIDQVFSKHNPYTVPSIINPDFANQKNIYSKLHRFGMDESGWFSMNDIYEQRKRHFEDVFHWNSSNTLAAKLSIKYSLWKRDPTNDLRVIKFCLSLPEDQYVQSGMDRALIRRATAGILPDSIRLNQRLRGVQGADWVYRMVPQWNAFIEELKDICSDQELIRYIDRAVLSEAIKEIENNNESNQATNPRYKILMRVVIFSRFIKKFT